MGNDITAFKQLKEKQIPQYEPIRVNQFMINLQKKIIDQIQCNFCKNVLYSSLKCKTCQKQFCSPCLTKFHQSSIENIDVNSTSNIEIRYCPSCSQKCQIQLIQEKFKESQKQVDQLLQGQLVLCPKSLFGCCKQILNYEDYYEKVAEHFEKVHKRNNQVEEDKQQQSQSSIQKKKSNLFSEDYNIPQSTFVIKKSFQDQSSNPKVIQLQSQMPSSSQQQQQQQQPVQPLESVKNGPQKQNNNVPIKSDKELYPRMMSDEIFSIINSLNEKVEKLQQENSSLKSQLQSQQNQIEIIQDEFVKQFNYQQNKINLQESQINYLYNMANQQSYIQQQNPENMPSQYNYPIENQHQPEILQYKDNTEHYLALIDHIKQNINIENDQQQLKLLECWEELLGFGDKSFWKVTYKNPKKIQDLSKLIQVIDNMGEQIKSTNSCSLKIMIVQKIDEKLVVHGIWLFQGVELHPDIKNSKIEEQFEIKQIDQNIYENKQFIYYIWKHISKEQGQIEDEQKPLHIKMIL